jgi:predicted HicB family RNase H-like nuclease
MADCILRYNPKLRKRVELRAVEERIAVKELIIKAVEYCVKAFKGEKGWK